ncbi:hypothetical protein [Clostridium tarantellae]|uniref:Uncharacterized protein n=1 Tax=Clostridium tarantellae TaxID=39493 RepID=A0A6I1MLU3_9CLOT|nr:hypothetical protein [Clostridium tarantellae]MPQ43974.1 hypothetical protein [Clostridium tarantellae]
MSKHKHRSKFDDKDDNNGLNINPELFKMLGLGEIDNNSLAQMISSIKQENFSMDSMNNVLKDLLLKNSTNNNYPDISNLANMLTGSMKGSNNMGNMLASLLSGSFNPQFTSQDTNFNNNESNVRLNINNDNMYSKRKTNNISDKDDKVRMLSSLKNFVDEDKIKFLDKVIEMYKKGEIIYR